MSLRVSPLLPLVLLVVPVVVVVLLVVEFSGLVLCKVIVGFEVELNGC
jgi:hypothetical protein